MARQRNEPLFFSIENICRRYKSCEKPYKQARQVELLYMVYPGRKFHHFAAYSEQVPVRATHERTYFVGSRMLSHATKEKAGLSTDSFFGVAILQRL